MTDKEWIKLIIEMPMSVRVAYALCGNKLAWDRQYATPSGRMEREGAELERKACVAFVKTYSSNAKIGKKTICVADLPSWLKEYLISEEMIGPILLNGNTMFTHKGDVFMSGIVKR